MSEKNNKYTPNLRFPEFTGEWKEKTLGEVGYFVRGLSYNKSDVTEDASSTLVIRSNNIIQDSAVDCINGLQYVTKTPSEEQQLEKGDIVICLANGSSNLVGKTSSFDGNYTGVVTVGAFCGIFRSSLPICKYLVQTSAYKNKINLIKQGGNGALANLYGKDILGFSFFIPTAPEEQQKIASCLSAMDDLIAAQAEKVEVLKEKKTGLMQQLFPQSGETTPRLRFPEFTGEWEEKKVKEIFEITRGQVLPAAKTKPEVDGLYKYPVYSSQTMRNGLMGYYNEALFNNAITWTTDGANAGTVRYRKGDFYCTNVCGVLLSKDGYANECIAELLNIICKSHVSFVGNPKLMNNVMAEIVIPIPSLQEQQKIASCLSALDDQIAAETEKLTALKDYKKGLMQQLFPQPAK